MLDRLFLPYQTPVQRFGCSLLFAVEQVANFRPSAESLKRLAELLDRQRESNLTDAESSELDNYVRLEHILGLAKAKAQLILAGRS
ncbi:MAG TPA: hypothetical protein VKY31_00905 [Terriglobia bacterium]|nr:hypothetical protein [Terriglobia bacterium]